MAWVEDTKEDLAFDVSWDNVGALKHIQGDMWGLALSDLPVSECVTDAGNEMVDRSMLGIHLFVAVAQCSSDNGGKVSQSKVWWINDTWK